MECVKSPLPPPLAMECVKSPLPHRLAPNVPPSPMQDVSSPLLLPPSDLIRPDLAPAPTETSLHRPSPSDPIRPDLAPAGMQHLVSLVNKLQRACTALGEHGALPTIVNDLPSVVFVGPQSSGKSSVLESLVGKDFLPKGPGIVTRRPLVLQLRGIGGTGEYAEFLHQPGKRFTDFAEVRKEIADETDRETGFSKAISSVPIHLSIYSPNVVNLTFIDLPGLTKVAVDGQSESIVQDIENMVRAFIEKPNCIILAVSPASQDLATSDAIKISQEVDPKGERTFGVLTKIDLMDKGTDSVDILEGRSYKVPFRWIGVVNRSQLDIDSDLNISAARLREHGYFANTTAYKHLAHRMGVTHLGLSLAKHLEDNLKSRVSTCEIFQQFSVNSGKKKNMLQGYTLRSYGSYPNYVFSTRGYPGSLQFSCDVILRANEDPAAVYSSVSHHPHLKDAEEDAAAVAYKALFGDDTMDTLLHLIDEGKICLVSTLKEFSMKKDISQPVFASSMVSERNRSVWISTVEIDGQLYLGDLAANKRLSAQKAASTAIKCVLEDGDELLIRVLQGKRLLNAVPLKLRKKSAGKRKIGH